MLHGCADSLIGPTRQWTPEVGRQNGVRDFVRQYGVKDALRCADHFHLEIANGRGVVGGHTLCRKARSCHNPNGTWSRPRWKRFAEPVNGKIAAIAFSCFSDRRSKLWSGSLNDEILGSLVRSIRCCATEQGQATCDPRCVEITSTIYGIHAGSLPLFGL